jgi:hypothetical protein
MSDVSPTEQVHEQILDHAREARDSWINRAAATASVLAALAAVSGAMSTHYLTVSGRNQIQANDQWSHYQAKSIKAAVLRSKADVIAALGKPAVETDGTKLQEYEHDLEQLKEHAEEQEKASELNLSRHEILERGVTLFHIAIAVVAIAVLTRKSSFWYLSLLAGAVGIVFFAQVFWL